ncbi:ribonuclease HII [Nonomuraea sp. KC401]|uniref:Ribonuclease HII n=1 Tax=Nonomuraea longispora TaxID=1848320 RepID=A0A4R4NDY4_9ACTN|nr:MULTISPECIES: ribonuclease HII [Nonomuraea]NBF00478.1 ribonuclease HII [Nonomuraea sp. K271]TDC05387.1 ribonuclease HII [Nonomuraea longispora]TLF48217.1 ribonuclease HII [Nonomuraea sp. KC401]
MAPTYDIEHLLLSQPSVRTVAGVDEVGRGAWAGPVTVCAVVTDLSEPPAGLTDSKQVSAAKRAPLAAELAAWAAGVGYGEVGHEEIDELGMTKALRRAARRALEALPVRPDAVILDGKHDYIGAPWPVRLEIGGDAASISVAAASVLAKVRRDAYMGTIGCDEYGFAENAGYPSPLHQEALARLGPTPHHRLSWSYLDGLPQWRHLKQHRDPLAGEGQATLFG